MVQDGSMHVESCYIHVYTCTSRLTVYSIASCVELTNILVSDLKEVDSNRCVVLSPRVTLWRLLALPLLREVREGGREEGGREGVREGEREGGREGGR